MERDELISKGAESYIYLIDWFGRKAIKKVRVKKGYRHPKIDETLRVSRTKREAKILQKAKSVGVPVPAVFALYPREATIIMEHINGTLLRDLLKESKLTVNEEKKIFRVIGEYIAHLHNEGIIHGDLTTSNVIINGPDNIVFIDFGLGLFTESIEDFGIELRVLYNALKSTHYDKVDYLFNSFLDGYLKEQNKGKEVYVKFKDIGLRGRYVEERRKRKFTVDH